MFLAVVTEVYEHNTDKGTVRKAHAVPIQTGELDVEILSRVKGRLTRWIAGKILEKPLKSLETDVKMQTVTLSMFHG